MNDPAVNRIPLFRDDYERLKRETLRAREDILLAAYCCTHLRFGYIVITSERVVYVAFGAKRSGWLGFDGNGRVRIVGEFAIETRLIPKSRLTAGEIKTRQVFEMPLGNIIRVERLRDVDVATHGRRIRVVRLALRVLRESTFDVDRFPRLLVFWDELEARRAYDLLETATTGTKSWLSTASYLI